MPNLGLTFFYDDYHQKNKNDFFDKYITENNFTYFLIIRALKKIEARANGSLAKVLDLGCGVGTIALFLARRGYEVVGVDISPQAIKIAEHFRKSKKIKNISFVQGSAETVTVAKSFDMAVCSEVIEHVPNDDALLKNIHKHLRKNGYLLLTTPSQAAPLYRLGLLKKFDEEVGHLRRYTKEMLMAKLHKNGFEVLEIYGTESILRNALFTLPHIGILIKLLKGPLVPLFHALDTVLVWLGGESNWHVIAQKK
jgi:ubiquinone biosynthesis O-methyltransferase